MPMTMAIPGKVGAVAKCPYCVKELPDMGLGFEEHVTRNRSCRQAHEEWKVRLDEDRPDGG
jgi:hypothetical protein